MPAGKRLAPLGFSSQRAGKKRKPTGPTKAERDRTELVLKLSEARNAAYHEQERRTVDPVVKRAVYDALEQMKAFTLGEPCAPRPVSLDEIVRMKTRIEVHYGPWQKELREGKIAAMTLTVLRWRILVHHYVGYPPELWMVTCHPFVDKKELQNTDLEKACDEALRFVQERVQELYTAFLGG